MSHGRIEENQYYLFRVKFYCNVVLLQGLFIIFGSERFVSLIFGFLSSDFFGLFCIPGHVSLSEVDWVWSRTTAHLLKLKLQSTKQIPSNESNAMSLASEFVCWRQNNDWYAKAPIKPCIAIHTFCIFANIRRPLTREGHYQLYLYLIFTPEDERAFLGL